MESKNLFILGTFVAPDKSAGAYRSLQNAKILSKEFNNIFICSSINGEEAKEYSYNDKIRFVPYCNANNSSFIYKTINLLFPRKKIIKIFKGINNQHKITHILIYSSVPLDILFWLKTFSKKNGLKIIYDVVEYQVISQQSIGSFFSYYLPQMYINKSLKKGDNVISISQYLHKLFLARGCNSTYQPILNDNANIVPSMKRSNKFNKKLVLLYAGSPRGKRDLVANMINGINMLEDEEKKQVLLVIAGISHEDLILKEGLSIKTFENSVNSVLYLGRVDRTVIEKLYFCSDFSVLIKPENKRFSNAGFPTKISESFAYGVPSICNISSDLEKYLVNGKNSIVLENDSAEEFSKKIRYALSMSPKALCTMRKEARKTSEELLDLKCSELLHNPAFK